MTVLDQFKWAQTGFKKDVLEFLKDIKIIHTLFAMPFAFSALFLGKLGLPSALEATFLLLCMISARSFAMGMNRYLDREIDAENPRTKIRAIPSGRVGEKSVLFISLGWAVLFSVCSFFLNSVAGYCSFGVLLILGAYPYWKRISWLTHWYLGFCLSLSPIAVAVALEGEVPISLFFLASAILFWTAGFDILYSIQDMESDKQHNLKSIPARFGARIATDISRLCFIVMWLFLIVTGLFAFSGPGYFLGILVIGSLLIYEQYLVRDLRIYGKSKNLNMAFFNMNAYVSVIFFVFTVTDKYF